MVLTDKLRRPSALAVAALLLLASIVPLLSFKKVGAYGLLGSRYIKMSSSAVGSVADGQDVIYEVGFTTSTTDANFEAIVIDFCANTSSPIIGDQCTAPAGFDLDVDGSADTVALALGTQSGVMGWTIDTTNSTASTLVLTRAGSLVNSGTPVVIPLGDESTPLSGIINPTTTNQTFYARIITYNADTEAQAYDSSVAGPSSTNPGDESEVIDAGGIALSTTAQITITAKVQERLTFCVYTAADCATGGTAVPLGDTTGVLDDTDEFVDKTTKYDVSTNAASGAAIRVKGDTLTSGAFTINPAGATPTQSTEASEQFGFCSYQASGAGLTVTFKYDGNGNVGGGGTGDCTNGTSQTAGTGTAGGAGVGGANDPYFAFDTANINTTYGEQFATKAAGTLSQGIIAFIGNISPTTEAGIYTTTLTFIATGTY